MGDLGAILGYVSFVPSLHRFTRANAASLLQAAAQEGGSLQLWFEPPFSDLAQEVVLLVSEGYVQDVVKPEHRSLEYVLQAVALAPSGTLQTDGVQPSPSESGTPLRQALSDAEQEAMVAHELVSALGGYGACYIQRHEQLMAVPPLPASVTPVLRLIDGERCVSRVLGESPFTPRLSAAVLNRLRNEGLIALPPADMSSLALANQDTEHSSDEDILREAQNESSAEDSGIRSSDQTKPSIDAVPEPDEVTDPAGASLSSEEEVPYEAAGLGPSLDLKRLGTVLLATLLLLGFGLWWTSGRDEPEPEKPTVVPEPPPPPPPSPEPPLEVQASEPPLPRLRGPRRTARSFSEVMQFGTPLERARALVEVGDAEAAETLLSNLRKSKPVFEVWRLSAQAAVDLGQADQALVYTRQALQRKAKDATVWTVKGSAHQFLGQTVQAIEAYERSLEIDPSLASELEPVLDELRNSQTE